MKNDKQFVLFCSRRLWEAARRDDEVAFQIWKKRFYERYDKIENEKKL